MADANSVPDLVLLWLLLTRFTMGLREEKEDWRAEAGAVQGGPPEEEGRDQRRELELELEPLDKEALEDEEDEDENQLLIKGFRTVICSFSWTTCQTTSPHCSCPLPPCFPRPSLPLVLHPPPGTKLTTEGEGSPVS